jgi:hypothetical protein
MPGREEKSKCQDCGRVWMRRELQLIRDISLRVDPGEPMPSGVCPMCGALCQPVEVLEATERHRKALLLLDELAAGSYDESDIPPSLVELIERAADIGARKRP